MFTKLTGVPGYTKGADVIEIELEFPKGCKMALVCTYMYL